MKLFDLRNAAGFSALSISTLAIVSMAGCGGHGTTPPITPQGNTKVTVLLSSTANDRLTRYELDFQGITLTSQAGKTVSLLTTAQNAPSQYTPEFMHLNGAASTLLTATVPEDTYTSASLTVGGASFTCIAVNQSDGSLTTSIFAYGQTPQSQVTVNLPAPVVVTGDTMNLSMQLDGAKSYTLSECPGGSAGDTYTITPTFNLTAADLSSSPTNYLNGEETNVLGQVNAASSTGFSVALGYSYASAAPLPTQNITANPSTMYQGISGLSALTQGTFVDMDLAAQSDGSLLATRVAVHDPAAVDVVSGPLAQVASSVPAIFSYGQQVQGPDLLGNTAPFDLSKAAFSISQQYTNLASLPFTPNFQASNLVPGQNVYITMPASTVTGINRYPLANTMTLMPQTVDGVVTAMDSSGDFDVYTITLASYNLFPALAGQQGATNLISVPQRIVVYADGNASLASTAEPVIGGTYRFHGLVFNDAGTLRMDCDQVDTGVTQ
jgi:hypothetical protein